MPSWYMSSSPITYIHVWCGISFPPISYHGSAMCFVIPAHLLPYIRGAVCHPHPSPTMPVWYGMQFPPISYHSCVVGYVILTHLLYTCVVRYVIPAYHQHTCVIGYVIPTHLLYSCVVRYVIPAHNLYSCVVGYVISAHNIYSCVVEYAITAYLLPCRHGVVCHPHPTKEPLSTKIEHCLFSTSSLHGHNYAGKGHIITQITTTRHLHKLVSNFEIVFYQYSCHYVVMQSLNICIITVSKYNIMLSWFPLHRFYFTNKL